MRHPTDGTLRRLVDEPEGVADTDREHVAQCPVCLAELAGAREDADVIGAALSVELDTDVDEAWHRLLHSDPTPQRVPARRWRSALRRPVIATVGVIVVLSGAGVAAAANWLPIFRAEQVAPLRVTQADLVKLPDLSDFGDVEVTRELQLREVDDAAGVTARTGLAVPRVADLPRGVTGEPVYRVAEPVSAMFTFSAEKARRIAEAAGGTLPPPPPGLDGSQYRFDAGPGFAAVWSEARGLPAMIVARAVAPTVSSTGIQFETARDYLLSVPGLPADVASQLRAYSREATTLPVVVPTEEMNADGTDVGGAQATVFTSRDDTLAVVIWVDDGKVTAVAGSMSDDEVIAVARGLRWGS
jgi:hypothetical protein